jgi:hypothetical protein
MRYSIVIPFLDPSAPRPLYAFSADHRDLVRRAAALFAGAGVVSATPCTWGAQDPAVTLEVDSWSPGMVRRHVGKVLTLSGAPAARVAEHGRNGTRVANYWRVAPEDLETFPDGVRVEYL